MLETGLNKSLGFCRAFWHRSAYRTTVRCARPIDWGQTTSLLRLLLSKRRPKERRIPIDKILEAFRRTDGQSVKTSAGAFQIYSVLIISMINHQQQIRMTFLTRKFVQTQNFLDIKFCGPKFLWSLFFWTKFFTGFIISLELKF